MRAALEVRAPDVVTRARVRILGAVQGVGFRPAMFRLATELGLTGWVNNSPQGVTVEIEGPVAATRDFILRIESGKPPRSFIQSLETSWLPPAGYRDFSIRASDTTGAKTALILPDIAPCPECLAEIFDPANRRHLYPFTNCTHCGPRFTIIESLPYDRPNTSMRDFAMCPECLREYGDPLDRRFHAQPNACPACGPQIELGDRTGHVLCSASDALLAAAEAIRAGSIVALKGVGGFHLMTDARNPAAVRALRERKHREEKPLAVMAPALAAIRRECEASPLEERLLLAPEAPIVLLRRVSNSTIAPDVAPGNPMLGMMLPSSPLHHLLMARLGFPAVATSANISGEPICIDNRDCLTRMAGVADFFLLHNRRIVRHADDSIARIVLGREMLLRRARGYAPLPIRLARPVSPLLATGAHLKSTAALASGRSVFISQHIGDLETAPALAAFESVIADFQRLYEIRPAAVAADAHPDYLSTQFAARFSARTGCPILSVQHHFAHVLSCMAENEIEVPALGVAWDGTGLGPDGTIWGGEFLKIGAGPGYERAAHLRTFPLPGGDAAVREPRRCALGLLYEVYGQAAFDMDLPTLRAFSPAELAPLRTMLLRGVNTPRTSSAGRLFDAIASLAGIRHRTAFEGQAAMALEFAADSEPCAPYPFTHSGPALDWEPMVRAMVADVREDIPAAAIAARFHLTLAGIITAAALRIGESVVILTGGCFQNELLLRLTVLRLREAGLRPVWHQRVPPNDGGIALGQIAASLRRQLPTPTPSDF